MIERNGNTYTLQCDYCSNYVDNLEDFQEAVDYKKERSEIMWRNSK